MPASWRGAFRSPSTMNSMGSTEASRDQGYRGDDKCGERNPDDLPWVGGTFRATGTGLPTNALVFAVTSLSPMAPALPLSIVFSQAGPGCDLFVAPDILDVLVTTTGTAQSQLFLANVPSLAGVIFYHQMVPIELDALGAWVAVSATNALQLTVGVF